MTIDLSQPLDLDALSSEQERMLRNLQGNILRGHGRDHAIHVFVSFDTAESGRAFLRKLAGAVTSAAEQTHFARQLSGSGLEFSGRMFLGVALSYAGYRKLGVDEHEIPANVSFKAGMRERSNVLYDPPVATWDAHFRDDIHAMLLVAHDSQDATSEYCDRLLSLAPQGVRVLGREAGDAMRSAGQRIEHFGYADGLSLTVFVKQDLRGQSTVNWNPLAPLELVLERCGTSDATSFGSYLVFRKLEQNVRRFAEAERELAQLSEIAPDEAGAVLIGRRRDGSALMMQPAAAGGSPNLSNDFNYASDRNGGVCPFGAHIRKMNPRGSTLPTNRTEGESWERQHVIARRSITYGTRQDDPRAPLPPEQRPESGVGLLFMCFQRDIGVQFEVVQRTWAQDPLHPDTSTPSGTDTMVGRRVRDAEVPTWPMPTGAQVKFRMPQCVTPKGGEYFFAPSIGFLKAL